MNRQRWNRCGLNGNQLKLIAVVSMLLDHIGYLLVGSGILRDIPWGSEAHSAWMLIYALLRSAGRVAFPIFCFLLVEGFFHTRSRRSYGLRLAAFAVISEVPFDLFSAECFPYWLVQNVFITLFLGFLMLVFLDIVARNAPARQRVLQQLFVVVTFCALAWFAHCDYDYSGIMLIAMFYMLRYDRKQACLIGFAWMGMMEGRLYYLPGLMASFWLISRYNGERGKLTGTKADKYFFYLFYPVHLLILYLIYTMIF